MESKRVTVLMAVLLILIFGYLSRPYWEMAFPGPQTPGMRSPLPGENAISGLTVHQDEKGRWIADFDYFYTGAPYVKLIIWLSSENTSSDQSQWQQKMMMPGATFVQRGQHHERIEIWRPRYSHEAFVTTQVNVEMLSLNWEPGQLPPPPVVSPKSTQKIVASQFVGQTIEWPDMRTWELDRRLASKAPDEILKEAIAEIDAGDEDSVAQAKQSLEWLISKDPKLDAAYVELARVAMKLNWGPEGLHQAENLIQSALQIHADSVNAKILLGYVYAHQKRYRKAENLFAEAALTDTKNLWLWANWGEVLVMQGKVDQGIQKYREAVVRPRAKDTYDRARLDAYRHLIVLLERKNDLEGLEALYRQRADEHEAGNCYNADYARFVLQQRGDSEKAITFARKAVDGHCTDAEAKEALGLANYVAWAEASAEHRAELLNQARVFLPLGPRPMYLLAKGDKSAMAIKSLVESGESIDQPDNDKWNALSYALGAKDYKAASQLARLGARLDTPVGPYQMPAAMLPVVEGDVDGIRLMRKFGVNYSKLQYQGASVFDHVKRSGNRKLIEEVDPKASAL